MDVKEIEMLTSNHIIDLEYVRCDRRERIRRARVERLLSQALRKRGGWEENVSLGRQSKQTQGVRSLSRTAAS